MNKSTSKRLFRNSPDGSRFSRIFASTTPTAEMVQDCLNKKPVLNDDVEFYGTVLPILCIVGAVSNCIALWILQDRNFFKRSTNYYISVLAAAHTLALLALGAVMVFTHHFHDVYYAEFAYTYFVWPAFVYFSSLPLAFLVAIVIERYYFLQTAKFDALEGQRRKSVIFVVTAVLIGVLHIPKMLCYTFDLKDGCRSIRWQVTDSTSWFKIYTYARFVVVHAGAVVVLLIFALMLAKMVYQCRAGEPSQRGAVVWAMEAKKKRERPLTLTLLGPVFLCCSIEILILLINPVVISSIWARFEFCDANFRLMVKKVGLMLVLAEYSLDLPFYFAFFSGFRKSMLAKIDSAITRLIDQRLSSSPDATQEVFI